MQEHQGACRARRSLFDVGNRLAALGFVASSDVDSCILGVKNTRQLLAKAGVRARYYVDLESRSLVSHLPWQGRAHTSGSNLPCHLDRADLSR